MKTNSIHISEQILKEVPLFQALTPEALSALANSFAEQELEDGEVLFRMNDPGDRFYVVAQGELEVIRYSTSQRVDIVISKVTAGGAVGEMAILLKQRRSATVRARGNTRLFWLSAHDFLSMAHRWPDISIGIARYLGDRLTIVQDHLYEGSNPQTWGVACGALIDAAFVKALVKNAQAYLPQTQKQTQSKRKKGNAHSPVAVLWVKERGGSESIALDNVKSHVFEWSDGAAEKLSEAIAKLKERARLVIVFASPKCIAATQKRYDHFLWSEQHTTLFEPIVGKSIELGAYGAPSSQRVVIAQQPINAVAARVVRMFLGCSIGLALGGGAALGMAHLGVLDVLERHHIPVDYLCGTSMGALIGALYLSNGLMPTMALTTRMHRVLDWIKLVDLSFLATGILQGNRMMRFFDEQLERKTFESLPVPLSVIGFDVLSGEEKVLKEGLIKHSVRASISIPGLFTPCIDYDGPQGAKRILVDGGVINNVPVDVVRGMGADRVIGVHVMMAGGAKPADKHPSLSQFELFGRKFMRRPVTSRIDILLRSHFMLMVGAGDRQVFTADVGLIPNTSNFNFLEFWRASELIETGRAVASAQLPQLQALHLYSPDIR